MASKLVNRAIIIPIALIRGLFRKPLTKGKKYNRILISHNLLLGDTILLTPLLAKIRAHYSHAHVFLIVSPNLEPLYKMMPYGVHTLKYHPRMPRLLISCFLNGPYDIALVPGDNRYTWLARALGSKTIVTLTGDGKKWKDWQSDHSIAWPNKISTLAEVFSNMIPGDNNQKYNLNDWPLHKPINFKRPSKPYYILHVSSRNQLRRWPESHWRKLANKIKEKENVTIVWSTGPDEKHLLDAIRPTYDEYCYFGTLDLLQLTHLIKESSLLITVETGISHLCRITGTKSVVIYGQGNPSLHGSEQFWKLSSPQLHIFLKDISCRDSHFLFGRNLEWVLRCDRNTDKCSDPYCIRNISPELVYSAIKSNKYSIMASKDEY